MARIFISSADGVYESAGDVNYSDNGSRSQVNYQANFRHGAILAVAVIMVGHLLPMTGWTGVGIVKVARTLRGKLI